MKIVPAEKILVRLSQHRSIKIQSSLPLKSILLISILVNEASTTEIRNLGSIFECI